MNESETIKKQTRYVKSIIVQVHAQCNEINLPDLIVVREKNLKFYFVYTAFLFA